MSPLSVYWRQKIYFLTVLTALGGSACRPSVDDNTTGDSTVSTVLTDGSITPAKLSQAYLPLAGGTMADGLNMGGQSLTNLSSPSGSSDAATKGYADSYLGGQQINTSALGSISNNQVLGWNSASSKWAPLTVVGAADATAIQGTNVDSTAPTTAKVLVYDTAVASKWAAATLGASSITSGALTSTQVSATGGISTYAVSSKTANYTLTSSDGAILCNAAGGGFTITLPAAATAGLAGKVFTIKKTDSTSNAVTIDPNGAETLDGSATVSLSAQYQSVEIASDGTNWAILASRGAQLFPLVGTSYAYLTVQGAGAAGWGSTKTFVARFTTASSAGSDLTITQDATNGDSITVNTAGGYYIEANLFASNSSNVAITITKNSTDPGTNDPLSNDLNGTILKAQFANESNNTYSGNGTSLTGIVTLSAADVLRVHGRGTGGASGTFPYAAYFKVTRFW